MKKLKHRSLTLLKWCLSSYRSRKGVECQSNRPDIKKTIHINTEFVKLSHFFHRAVENKVTPLGFAANGDNISGEVREAL